MTKFLVLLAAVLMLTLTVSAVCVVKPQEAMWDQSSICLKNDPYPQEMIEYALLGDEKATQFINYAQHLYDTMADPQTLMKPKYYCDDVCPEIATNLTMVYMPDGQECYVVHPWIQSVQYITCGTADCMIANNYARNYYCIPDAFIKRKVLVYCPWMLPQCQYLDMKFPTACSCKSYFCNKKKMSTNGLLG